MSDIVVAQTLQDKLLLLCASQVSCWDLSALLVYNWHQLPSDGSSCGGHGARRTLRLLEGKGGLSSEAKFCLPEL